MTEARRPDAAGTTFDDLVPAWMFIVRPAWLRLLVGLLVPAAWLAPLVLMDDPSDLRFGPLLAVGIVLVAAVAGWWPTLVATAVLTTGYWWYGVPESRSFHLAETGDAVAVAAMGVIGLAIGAMAKRVERAVEEVRALDRARRTSASAEASLRRATERAVVEVEGVLQLSNALAKAPTMAEVAKVATEAIALPSWPTSASVALVQGNRLRILAARGATADSIEALERVNLTTSSWLGDVIGGRPAIVDDRERFAAEHPDARVLGLYPCGSWAAIPFRSESNTGLLSLYWFEPQPLTDFSRYFSLVAEILATALERAGAEEDRQTHLARLEHAFAEADRIARTLSTTLLPPQLPKLPGCSSAGWLMPAHDEVAGDFYDLFAVPEGWVAVLGDVCGKGAEAAAVTSLARYAARATALSDPDPAHIADVVNTALVEDESDVFCTMAAVRYDAARCEVDVTLAGHPQLRIVHGGTVTRVGRYGSVLGYATNPPEVERCPLPPGATIVLFSDGLIERHPDFGEDELDALLLEAPDGPAEVLAAFVRERILAVPAARHDDLALLVVRREG